MKQHIDGQDKSDQEAFYFIANLHTLTTIHSKEEVVENTLGTVLDYLALGLDPEKATIFLQSDVQGHCELSWIFSTLTSVSEVERIPTYKEKKAIQAQDINVGLLYYPILMAADILLYRANEVPVGDDQKPNVEMARDIAKRFNKTYGETFPIPEFTTRKETSRIMSLDGKGKMSKSDNSGIGIFEDPQVIIEKFKKAKTDSDSEIRFGEDKPEISNLLTIYMAFTGKDKEAVVTEMKGKGYGEFKELLGQTVADSLAPFRAKRQALEKNTDKVKTILADGAAKASTIVKGTMAEVKDKVGLKI